MASRPTSSRPTSTASSVRRNLFHHHLSRRPTAAAAAGTASTTTSLSTANAAGHGASNMTTTTSASTATSKSAGGAAPATATALQEAGDDCHNGDIVVRNKNGEYDLEVPLMPIDRQDDRYERETNMVLVKPSHFCDANRVYVLQRMMRAWLRRLSITAGIGIVRRASLLVSLRPQIQPLALLGSFSISLFEDGGAETSLELFVAVQASLRNTVASLHDDDWMYDNQDSDS
ncbi:MAG: hypothetical protein M1825_003679 [Sarcosagium campestre]|nr:MAG: hypothetical protein M1825_003679 [Sarcosagium campestre]